MRKIFVHSFIIDIATRSGMNRIRFTGDGRDLTKIITDKIPSWRQAWIFADGNDKPSIKYRR